MVRSLPEQPNLEHLRSEAKALLKSHRRGDHSVCDTFRHVPRLAGCADREILALRLTLQQVQHALARSYGFSSWIDLKRAVAARRAHVGGAVPEKLSRLLGSPGARTRVGALRELAARIHPNGEGPAPFGWGLAHRASTIPEAAELLAAVLKDRSWRVRREAVCALAAYAHLVDPRVREPLEAALQDRSHKVQHAAARALGVRCPGCGSTPKLADHVPETA